MNPKHPLRLAGFLSLLLVAGCQSRPASASFDLSAVKSAIAASNLAYADAVARQDPSGIVACYSPDACLYPPNSPALCGADAIRGFYQSTLAQGIRGITLTSTEVTGGPGGVTEVGTYALRIASGAEVDRGNYIVLWVPVGGQWRMHRDVFNSAQPAPSR